MEDDFKQTTVAFHPERFVREHIVPSDPALFWWMMRQLPSTADRAAAQPAAAPARDDLPRIEPGSLNPDMVIVATINTIRSDVIYESLMTPGDLWNTLSFCSYSSDQPVQGTASDALDGMFLRIDVYGQKRFMTDPDKTRDPIFRIDFPAPDQPSVIHWSFINDYCRHFHHDVFAQNGWDEEKMKSFNFKTTGPSAIELMALIETAADLDNSYRCFPEWQPGVAAGDAETDPVVKPSP